MAEVSELPVKANDHLMDATRYALHSVLGRGRRTQAYLDYVQAFVDRRRGT